jgi:hypothetical protein
LATFPQHPLRVARAAVWGVSASWPLVLSTLLGLWLLFAPTVLGSMDAAADNDQLVGALIITVAVIALAEVARAGRFLNVVLALWLVLAPWVLSGGQGGATVNTVLVGGSVLVLSLPRGKVLERYGTWDHAIV